MLSLKFLVYEGKRSLPHFRIIFVKTQVDFMRQCSILILLNRVYLISAMILSHSIPMLRQTLLMIKFSARK